MSEVIKRGTAQQFETFLEEGIREIVLALRDAGLNTIASCHHRGYVEAQSTDPTLERMRIWNVMHELKVEQWEAELYVNQSGFDSWHIESPSFRIRS